MDATQSDAHPKFCETCGAQVCDVRVADNGWVKADWPPVLPVMEFGTAIIATAGTDLNSAKYTYDGVRAPGHIASMLVVEHNCEARTRLERVWTAAGRKAYAEHLAESEGA